MSQRLLIVGASGFVGSRLGSAAGQDFTVIRGSRNPPPADDAVAIDIADAASVHAAFDKSRPDLVVLLAALSDIDRCERERDLAERINFFGARNVAGECAARGLRLLYTSTDAVFDGTKHIYYEHDEPTPVNWYGQTKARAEATVGELTPTAAIVRLSLVLGRGAGTSGNSYLEKVVGNLKAGNQIITPTFEFRNPIDVATLCEFLLELAPQREATGIFHIGASDKMSRYDLARSIALHLGFDAALIVPQHEPSADRAPRGRDDFLVTERLRAVCRTPVPTCQQVIERACRPVD
jgi:dTDP-4-dehydrorhamnose reductase